VRPRKGHHKKQQERSEEASWGADLGEGGLGDDISLKKWFIHPDGPAVSPFLNHPVQSRKNISRRGGKVTSMSGPQVKEENRRGRKTENDIGRTEERNQGTNSYGRG